MSFDPIYDERPPRHPAEDTTEAVQQLTRVVERMDLPLPHDVAEIQRALDHIALGTERAAHTLVAIRRLLVTVCVLVFLLFWAVAVHAAPRSHSAIAAFKHAHPCPVTGQARGACPGWVIDHVQPLACGGADAAPNMQWQTSADAKAKDKVERKGCQAKR